MFDRELVLSNKSDDPCNMHWCSLFVSCKIYDVYITCVLNYDEVYS